MFGHFNSAELAVLVADKMNAYRQEAELERQLPRHALSTSYCLATQGLG